MAKAVKAPKPDAAATEKARRVAVVDELGQLEAELAAIAPKKKRVDVLKKEVQVWADQYPPETAIIFEGEQYCAQVSARTHRRRIADMAKVFVLLGKKKFLELCGFTLKCVEENLCPADVSSVVVEDQYVGERTVRSLQRANKPA